LETGSRMRIENAAKQAMVAQIRLTTTAQNMPTIFSTRNICLLLLHYATVAVRQMVVHFSKFVT
jgi:hypothetical protein